jgi:hypothetical protein
MHTGTDHVICPGGKIMAVILMCESPCEILQVLQASLPHTSLLLLEQALLIDKSSIESNGMITNSAASK